MSIYLNLPPTIHPTTISELLIYGFENGPGDKFVQTFTTQECIISQCSSARRSFEDLLEICQTYFSATTPKDLARCIWDLHHNYKFKKNDGYIRPIFCCTINKMVFLVNNYPWDSAFKSAGIFFKNCIDKRNGVAESPTRIYKSPWCYNDIMYLLIDFPDE